MQEFLQPAVMGMLRIKEHEVGELDALRAPWFEMGQDDGRSSLFASPLWVINYLRYRQRAGRTEKILAAYTRGGSMVGIVPLVRESHDRQLPMAGLRASHATGEYPADWACRKGHEEEFVAAVYAHLADQDSGWARLAFTDHPGDSPILDAVRAYCDGRGIPFREQVSREIPYLDVSDRDIRALDRMKSKHRNDVRRRLKALESEGVTILDEIRTLDHLEAGFSEFLEVESAGWKGREGGAVALQPDAREFWWNIAREAASLGCLRLYFLRLDGRAIATQLGLVWENRYHGLKIGYDEAYRRFSPGQVMTAHVLDRCIEDPLISEFDFSGKMTPAIRKWTSTTYTTLNVQVAASTLAGTFDIRMRVLRDKVARAAKSLSS